MVFAKGRRLLRVLLPRRNEIVQCNSTIKVNCEFAEPTLRRAKIILPKPGCFRRSDIAGWALHPLESAALSRARGNRTLVPTRQRMIIKLSAMFGHPKSIRGAVGGEVVSPSSGASPGCEGILELEEALTLVAPSPSVRRVHCPVPVVNLGRVEL